MSIQPLHHLSVHFMQASYSRCNLFCALIPKRHGSQEVGAIPPNLLKAVGLSIKAAMALSFALPFWVLVFISTLLATPLSALPLEDTNRTKYAFGVCAPEVSMVCWGFGPPFCDPETGRYLLNSPTCQGPCACLAIDNFSKDVSRASIISIFSPEESAKRKILSIESLMS